MPLYRVFTQSNELDQQTKESVAKSITDTHCGLTGAPKEFVHVFYIESDDVAKGTVEVLGAIRAGRSDEVKNGIIGKIEDAILSAADVTRDKIKVSLMGVVAKWVMEAGAIMPEPGQEAEWFAKHHR
ncbi:MAG: phenylpyruvate tautomerase PptA (4-oxalocrotonate tautomerase family) [Gammaproteobacteria bacterium]|jgi:phenylpyruvate tautomerase PptA (4-oxalocrotonate tautomerase family)